MSHHHGKTAGTICPKYFAHRLTLAQRCFFFFFELAYDDMGLDREGRWKGKGEEVRDGGGNIIYISSEKIYEYTHTLLEDSLI